MILFFIEYIAKFCSPLRLPLLSQWLISQCQSQFSDRSVLPGAQSSALSSLRTFRKASSWLAASSGAAMRDWSPWKFSPPWQLPGLLVPGLRTCSAIDSLINQTKQKTDEVAKRSFELLKCIHSLLTTSLIMLDFSLYSLGSWTSAFGLRLFKSHKTSKSESEWVTEDWISHETFCLTTK